MTKAEKTKQLIIEEAAAIMNKKGIAGTSMNDIMQATRLAKGGVYGNFESKDAICKEAFNYLADQQLKSLTDTINAQTTSKLKLYALFEYYDNRSLINTGGCPLLNFGTEADDTHPEIKQQVRRAMQKVEKIIAELVHAGIKAKDFKEHFNAELFASKAFAMIEGAVFVSRVQGSNRHLRIVIDALKKEVGENLK